MGGTYLSKMTSKTSDSIEKYSVETTTEENSADQIVPNEKSGNNTTANDVTISNEKLPEETTTNKKPKNETKSKEKPKTDKKSNEKLSEDRFVVKKWDAVVSWSYGVDNCAICKQDIMDLCNVCLADALDKDEHEECPVAWGVCDHGFHLHCIMNLIQKNNNKCPLCKNDWEFQKLE